MNMIRTWVGPYRPTHGSLMILQCGSSILYCEYHILEELILKCLNFLNYHFFVSSDHEIVWWILLSWNYRCSNNRFHDAIFKCHRIRKTGRLYSTVVIVEIYSCWNRWRTNIWNDCLSWRVVSLVENRQFISFRSSDLAVAGWSTSRAERLGSRMSSTELLHLYSALLGQTHSLGFAHLLFGWGIKSRKRRGSRAVLAWKCFFHRNIAHFYPIGIFLIPENVCRHYVVAVTIGRH